MSCDTCKNDNCTCEEKKIVDSNLSDAEREMIERIEFSVGYAININMTNFYKRELMKDVVDEYILHLEDELEDHPEKDTVEIKAKTKQDLLEKLDKIAQAPDGYSSLKEYAEIRIDLL